MSERKPGDHGLRTTQGRPVHRYLVLKEKAQRFNQDQEIQSIVRNRDAADGQVAQWQCWSPENAQALKEFGFDLRAMGEHPFGYQRLDQLTFELLTGVR